jgi:dephospho-CoA kinase
MVPADVELAAYARWGLLLRLQHHSDSVVCIDAELVDAADRLPRRDSYCIVSVKLHGLPAATVVDVDADVHLAIDRAADRAGRLTKEQVRQAGSPQAPRTEAVAA